jgi:uncharacterized protein
MHTHSSLVIDVLELLETPGSRKEVVFSTPPSDGRLEAGLARVEGELGFDLVLEAIEGGVYVKGTIEGQYEAECSRCLEPIKASFRLPAAELYRPAGDAWEEGYVVAATTIDLAPLVRDTVILSLPLTPLCREDCAGLCPRCGVNLNEGPHSCASEEGDPRWSALRELRDQLG